MYTKILFLDLLGSYSAVAIILIKFKVIILILIIIIEKEKLLFYLWPFLALAIEDSVADTT